MKKNKYNRIALIYFFTSWITGIFIIAGMILKISDDTVMILVFLSAINLIINLISILLLFTFMFVFPENWVEFKNSLILLIFNFPILFFLFLSISLNY